MVTKSNGTSEGVSSASRSLKAGAEMSGENRSTAPYSRTSPTKSCMPLMKSRGCSSTHTGSIEAIAA